MNVLIASLIAAMVGIAIGYFTSIFFQKKKRETHLTEKFQKVEKEINESEKKLLKIEKEGAKKEIEAEKEVQRMKDSARAEIDKKERTLEKELARLEEREKVLDEKVSEVSRQREKAEEKRKEYEEKEIKLKDIIAEEELVLEKISGLSKEEAKNKLFETIEKTAESDIVNKMHRMEERMKQEVDDKAKQIIIESVQRMASDVTSESTVSHLELESDDLKGRIIGKEGRNINAFERTTGVNLIIDDTPNVVILSSFDPMRRFIAAEVLKELLIDGRIHPARIEEVMKKKTKDVDKMIQKDGEEAVYETGVTGLPPEIIKILGRLRFRTSYGQNVLQHSVEAAFVAESLANELGANAELAKKAALLHDLGKTLSHEIGGKHALLSGEICRKFQMKEELVHAVEAHHEDVPMKSIEAYIVQAADAVSASRPGARRETSEKFIKRMIELEGIATSYKGVQKCFAMSAGREMWIFVDPKDISDLEASKLSQEIARRIEKDVQYPGEVKVVLHRDMKFSHTAH
jgi:ribonuclease Y